MERSDGVIVCSHCEVRLCGLIRIQFRIDYKPRKDKYDRYSFGKDAIRRLQPEICDSVESAKNIAYRIYSNEMIKIETDICQDGLITKLRKVSLSYFDVVIS